MTWSSEPPFFQQFFSSNSAIKAFCFAFRRIAHGTHMLFPVIRYAVQLHRKCEKSLCNHSFLCVYILYFLHFVSPFVNPTRIFHIQPDRFHEPLSIFTISTEEPLTDFSIPKEKLTFWLSNNFTWHAIRSSSSLLRNKARPDGVSHINVVVFSWSDWNFSEYLNKDLSERSLAIPTDTRFLVLKDDPVQES